MNKKQKKTLLRIIIAFITYIGCVVIEKVNPSNVFDNNIIAFVVFLIPYLIIGYDILLKAITNIKNGNVFDENFLMTIATFGAFGVGEYSEAVAVMLFYQVGEFFQSYAVNKSRKSISDMMDICPQIANREIDGSIEEVDPDEVQIDDVLVVKAGERIPLDGIVISGNSLVDTSALTGESVPRRVSEGDEIISGCVNGSGVLRIRVTKEFEDSTVSKILELVENASSRKAKVENFITKFAKYYTPIVVIGAVLLCIIPTLFFGESFGKWLQRACTFLVISCPCALVISVPLSFFGGIGAASKLGILIKGSNYIETLSKLKVVVFDKTGTLTKGEFKVTEINPIAVSKDELLELTAYVESTSTHPIAKSIIDKYNKEIDNSKIKNAEEISGHGIVADVNSKQVIAGNEKLMNKYNIKYTKSNSVGTVVYTAVDGVFIGSIIISDVIKEEAKDALSKLKKSGVKKTVMLTGDKKAVGEAVAKELNIDEVYTELLPIDKVNKVETLLKNNTDEEKLAFVGDGVNDAPVLTRADVGFAMGALGSDAAIEAADVVLMDDNIEKISSAIKLSRKTIRIVHQNIVFALAVKLVVLILGALGVAGMWAAVFSDVGVSVIAIINAMRTLKIK